jgi:galactan 5-O-arabinofuranosyltransferase
MDVLLSYSDLQHIILVKLCFFLFVALGLVAIYRKWKPGYFLILMGVCSGLAYFFLVHQMRLMFWGLEGDEITIAAMYQMFAHGSFMSDFAYAGLPPFYPPLWFWFFGLIGKILNYNGIQIAKIGAVGTIVFYPVLFFLIQKWFWLKQQVNDKVKEAPGALAWFLSAVFLFVLIDWDAIIIKPYELVSASLVVLWTTLLIYELHRDRLNGMRVIVFGITGGILFLLFYFWFFLAAIGIALFNLFAGKKIEYKKYFSLLTTGIVVLIVGAFYWAPLVRVYFERGSENWQLGFFVTEWIATQGPLFDLSLRGLLMAAGLTVLIIYRRQWYIRGLLSLFSAAYIWQLMGMITILFLASPLQESKGFYFFNRSVLALALAYGIERLWDYFTQSYPQAKWQKSVAIISLFFISTQLIFGSFVDQPKILKTRENARSLELAKTELVGFLEGNYSDIYQKTTLHSSLTWLHAFLPVNDFIYFNQHNSHPAAHFSERLAFVESLALMKSSDEFYQAIKNTPFGSIDLFIFYTGDPEYYPVYFHLDNFPYQFKELVGNIPRKLFDEKYFDKKFENKDYAVFAPKAL